MFDASAHPHAALCVHSIATQSIKTLIPIIVDLKALNFTKWCNFSTIVVTRFALVDHLDVVLLPDDGEWLRMDSTDLRLLYSSITLTL
jgi:hypothetical protein